MKISLGFYSQLSTASPLKMYNRALNLIIKPLLTYIYNNNDLKISIALSDSLIKHCSSYMREVNLLVKDLAKDERLELISTSYKNRIISQMPQKDRILIVDKCTTLIRKTYNQRSTTAFLYGGLWSPSLISTMNLVGLERLIIPSFVQSSNKAIDEEPFRVNEFGKKLDIVPTSDRFAFLISQYSENKIDFNALIEELSLATLEIKKDTLIMINIDQLLKGSSYNQDDQRLIDVFTAIYKIAVNNKAKFILPKQIKVKKIGYLDSLWYSRDMDNKNISCFNDLFVKNEIYRYYLNRVCSLSEAIAESKKIKPIKKIVQTSLASIPSGSLFIKDANASALRIGETRTFYKVVLEIEKRLKEYDISLDNYDLTDSQICDNFISSKTASAVLTKRGASVHEFSSYQVLFNFFATVSPYSRDLAVSKLRCFTDELKINAKSYNLANEIYYQDYCAKNKTEYSYYFDRLKNPFSISKHYKITNNSLILNITITNKISNRLSGHYITSVYFILPEIVEVIYENKKSLALTQNIKNVKYKDSKTGLALSFVSSDDFNYKQEDKIQSENTSLGAEDFYLYTKAEMDFSLNIEANSAKVISIVTKFTNSKEAE